MKKYIVTTTINLPTKATIKFCELALKKGWNFIIVGDKKTPHSEYEALTEKYSVQVPIELGGNKRKHIIYLHPDEQEELFPELSKSIGWNTIQRRNIGFVHAYNLGADVVATVDDDNIPYDNWSDDLYINKEIEIDVYKHKNFEVFDPLSVSSEPELWHRGYPIECVPEKNEIQYLGKQKRKVLIQADLWDGDPDIDAICRLSKKPTVKFDHIKPFGSNQLSPFNSQNTFLAREIIPYYAVLPFIGRMDDIWMSYIIQTMFKDCLIYNRASVYQERNEQDLVTNLENEILGYRTTSFMIWDTLYSLSVTENMIDFLPKSTQHFYELYKKQFNVI